VSHPALDQPGARLATDGELAQLEQAYADAAKLALEIGFDGVDLKMCHGYLMNELLGAQLRPGPYGGSLENRTRLSRNALQRIRDTVGDRLLLASRLSAYDGVPYGKILETPYRYGWSTSAEDPAQEDLTETTRFIGWLHDWGVRLINVTIGVPYFNPHIGRPFEKPDEGNYESPEHPLLGVFRHFRIARALQRSFPDLPMVGTGYSWLQKYLIHAGAANLLDGNITFVGVGRGALAYPDFARDALERGELQEKRCCKTVTFCTWLMRAKDNELGQFPTGCVPYDKDPYGKIMKEAQLARARTKKGKS
jgi:2,4-dienoyl-CoA reductase-like NADH-dependent reductase (Old Yellow Enzyme family)